MRCCILHLFYGSSLKTEYLFSTCIPSIQVNSAYKSLSLDLPGKEQPCFCTFTMKSAHFLRASLLSEATESRAGVRSRGSSQLSCSFPLNWGKIRKGSSSRGASGYPVTFIPALLPPSFPTSLIYTLLLLNSKHSAESLLTSHFPLNTCLHTSICSL